MSDPPSSRGPASSRGERRRRRKRVRRDPDAWRDKHGKKLWWFGTFVATVFAALATYTLVVFPAGSGPGAGNEVEITFTGEETAAGLTEKLDGAGLLRAPRMFGLYVRLVGARVAPGRHLLTDDAGPQEIVRRLERQGAGKHAKIVVPEGFTRFDIARRLQAAHVATQLAFLEATTDGTLLRELGVTGDSVEGMLFPATYEMALDSDPRELVRRMKTEFERRFLLLEENHRLGIAQLEGAFGWTKRDIVTLASLVEKEAAVDEERPIIASVFLNRLRDLNFKRKVLQCDPTAGYGCLVLRDKVPACAGYTGKITHAINMDPANAYSTYVHEGLPPGPIANPGIKSLQAVLAPANTKYLYFVARGENRRHTFSETAEEHNTAVKEFRDRVGGRRDGPVRE